MKRLYIRVCLSVGWRYDSYHMRDPVRFLSICFLPVCQLKNNWLRTNGYELTVTNWRNIRRTEKRTEGRTYGQIDGRTDWPANGQTNGRTDPLIELMTKNRDGKRNVWNRIFLLLVKHTIKQPIRALQFRERTNQRRDLPCDVGELRNYRSKWPICMKEPYHFR